MKKAIFILSLLIVLFAIVCLAGYFGGRYYFTTLGAEYSFRHPTVSKIFSLSPNCPEECLPMGICGKDGKNYCNSCLALKLGAGYAYDGPCKPESGWSVYKNFGIEFSYPNSKKWGFPVENLTGGIPQISFNNNDFSISILNGTNIDQAISGTEAKYIEVNGLKGREVVTADGFSTVLPFGSSYLIVFDGKNSLLDKNTFETLVSTFKSNSGLVIKKNPETSRLLYDNGDMSFEYPEGFGEKYASLVVQIKMAKPGDEIISSDCYVPQPSENSAKPQSLTINDMKFCLSIGEDVGAGQLYKSYNYTVFHEGYYYIVSYVVHTPNSCATYEGTDDYKPCSDFMKKYNDIVVKSVKDSIVTLNFKK